MSGEAARVGDRTCAHAEAVEGMCPACGHCSHEVVLNGTCFLCGASPRPRGLVEPRALVRKKHP